MALSLSGALEEDPEGGSWTSQLGRALCGFSWEQVGAGAAGSGEWHPRQVRSLHLYMKVGMCRGLLPVSLLSLAVLLGDACSSLGQQGWPGEQGCADGAGADLGADWSPASCWPGDLAVGVGEKVPSVCCASSLSSPGGQDRKLGQLLAVLWGSALRGSERSPPPPPGFQTLLRGFLLPPKPAWPLLVTPSPASMSPELTQGLLGVLWVTLHCSLGAGQDSFSRTGSLGLPGTVGFVVP